MQPESGKPRLSVGVIGVGYVGRAMIGLLEPIARVVAFDKAGADDPYPYDDLAACDFAVICVDTPPAADGSCDVGNVEEAIAALPTERVLVKSTIPPGTTEKLAASTGKSVCFSPEYLRESTYGGDQWNRRMADEPFTILGGEAELRRWLIDVLTPLFGPHHVWYQCSSREAEVIKYMENSWLATKVTFVNEFYEICRAVGVDWHTVREGWLLDPRVGRSHSAVFAADRGYGGKCLPKDMKGIIAAATQAGHDPQLLKAVEGTNETFRAEGKLPSS